MILFDFNFFDDDMGAVNFFQGIRQGTSISAREFVQFDDLGLEDICLEARTFGVVFGEADGRLAVHDHVYQLFQNEHLRDEALLEEDLVDARCKQVLVDIHVGTEVELELGQLCHHLEHVVYM